MRLAALQYRPPKGRPAEARADLCWWAEEAGQRGADLLVCPEMATTGYVWPDAATLRPFAEPADGPTLRALAPIAARHAMWIVVGYPEAAEALHGEALHNAALVIDHRGQLVDSYRKVLLYENDTAWATPGTRRSVYTTPFGRLAPGICMDINDVAFTSLLRVEQPDVIAFCTNWVDEGYPIEGYWATQLTGVRSYFVAADSWGRDGLVRFYGRSAIMRGGRVLVQAPSGGDCLILTSVATSSSAPTSGAR